MKVGDLVMAHKNVSWGKKAMRGIVVGFNEKGEGGQEFVHVLIEGAIHIFMDFHLEVISEGKR